MPSISQLQRHYNAHLPPGEVDILLCHALKKDRAFLFAHNDSRLSPIAYLQFRYFVWKRRRGIPIAYITHRKWFCGLEFFVNKHTLIPRPETEMMVEAAIQEIKNTITASAGSRLVAARNQKINVVDVGTGSGCIPIAVACELRKLYNNITMKQPPADKVKMYAIDISKKALKIAAKNARTQNVSIEFLHGNLVEPFFKEQRAMNNEQLIITANLPYLTQTQFDSEPSIQREPKTALVATHHGLALYQQLLQQIASNLFIAHCSLLIFIEIDPSQSTLITPLIHQHLPGAKIAIKADLAGHDRLVQIWLDKSEKKA